MRTETYKYKGNETILPFIIAQEVISEMKKNGKIISMIRTFFDGNVLKQTITSHETIHSSKL